MTNKNEKVVTRWYETGQLESESVYGDMLKSKICWYENGQKKSLDSNNISGSKTLKKRWYKNVQIKTDISFNDNYEELGTTWYENGNRENLYEYDSDKHITESSWYRDGQLKFIKTNKIDREYFINGRLKLEMLFHDSYSYDSSTWYQDGQLKHILSVNKDGNTTKNVFWDENGIKRCETFLDDNDVEISNNWYEDGSIESTTESDNNGSVTTNSWYESGQKKSKSQSNNKGEKILKTWFENGQLDSHRIYENGYMMTIVLAEWYNQSGKMVSKTGPTDKNILTRKTWFDNGQLESVALFKEFNQVKLSESWFNLKGKEVNPPKEIKSPHREYDPDLMDGLTDDEKELGSDFWNKIL